MELFVNQLVYHFEAVRQRRDPRVDAEPGKYVVVQEGVCVDNVFFDRHDEGRLKSEGSRLPAEPAAHAVPNDFIKVARWQLRPTAQRQEDADSCLLRKVVGVRLTASETTCRATGGAFDNGVPVREKSVFVGC